MNNMHFHMMHKWAAKGSIMSSNPSWSNFNFFQTLVFVLCSKAKIDYIFTEIINCLFSISIAHFSLWEQPKTTCVKRYIKYRLANALWYGNKKKSLTLSSYALHKNVLKRRTEKVLHRATTTTVLPLTGPALKQGH